MSTPSAEARTPADDGVAPARPRRPSVGLIVLGVIAAVFTVGWGIAHFTYKEGGSVSNQMISYSVPTDDEVSLRFAVGRLTPGHVTCLVRATDAQHVEVGTAEVPVPPGDDEVRFELATTHRAASAEITGCWMTDTGNEG
ncbi:DUF4307 domain-containing protein [Allonocardiopsis opalescens]|uniref:Uncharacterized protein DUF4307 n=1 Tax=Allonocardiopsis opalescens TaxID=1144618 RepID=A0A2T0QD60_9ACTN|nr:DUF4307 domain-containing protein [Allonocardiopsis opalescens]PRY01884.1 uncharacterized protein DUF4307 [Allonocardiopsis opalescens]